MLVPEFILFIPGPYNRPLTSVGLGVENIGGGGIGPISDNGIGGSGNSDSMTCCAVILILVFSIYGGGVEPGGPVSSKIKNSKYYSCITKLIFIHNYSQWSPCPWQQITRREPLLWPNELGRSNFGVSWPQPEFETDPWLDWSLMEDK